MSSIILRSKSISFTVPHRIQIDSRKNKLQLITAQENSGAPTFKRRHLKRSRFQAFVQNPISVPVPPEHFQLIPTTVEKHEQASLHRIAAQIILNLAAQTINRFAHVGRPCRQIHGCRQSNADHPRRAPAKSASSSPLWPPVHRNKIPFG